MTERNRELVPDSRSAAIKRKSAESCNPKLFSLSLLPFVMPVPVWFDSVTVVMEICIVAARLQLFDYHNRGAVS